MDTANIRMDPVNATVRFALELVAAYGIGRGLWETVGWYVAIPAVIAALFAWATFRVPDDPGPAPRPVSGAVRLALEAVILGAGAWGLWVAFGSTVAIVFLAVLAVHYATTPARLRHVLSFKGRS